MNIKRWSISLLLLLSILASCVTQDTEWASNLLDQQLLEKLQAASPRGNENFFLLPDESNLSDIPQDPNNILTEEKVELGKFLFHETGLGSTPQNNISRFTYSCATCHHEDAGFQAGRKQGIGEGGIGFGLKGETRVPNPHYNRSSIDVQPIRSPSALNVAFQKVMLWNGQFGAKGVNKGTEPQWLPGTPIETNSLSYEGVETQAIAGLTVHRLEFNTDGLINETNYKELFDKAFPNIPVEERYTLENVGLAIAAYERTLLPTQAPFQQWLKGDRSALSPEEKRGAILFFGKAGCAGCHTGPALSSVDTTKFYALGMRDLSGSDVLNTAPDDNAHNGRGGFTKREEDMYKFKVPQLYNLKDSPFYGHGGSFFRIKDVVDYKNEAVPENSRVPQEQIDPRFVPLGLGEEDVKDIASFLRSGLYDPHLDRYVPQSLPSNLCFPNNDMQSRRDLGCN